MALPQVSPCTRTCVQTCSSPTQGFTLIEVIIVLAIISTVSTIAVFSGLESYRQYLYHNDRDLLVTLLLHARAQSMGNICVGPTCVDGVSHGVAVVPSGYILFQGSTFALRDPSSDGFFERNPHSISSGVTEVVFTKVSGTTTGGVLTLDDGARTSDVTISSEGQITWTH